MLIFDLETDGLLHEVTKIHCAVIYDTLTKTYHRFRNHSKEYTIPNAVQALRDADTICGHNIIKFDLPVLKKLYGFTFQGTVLDTLVWARLVYPNIKDHDVRLMRKGILPRNLFGSHKLEAWGYRLGNLKGEYGKQEGAWDKWTPEMEEYCVQDVKL